MNLLLKTLILKCVRYTSTAANIIISVENSRGVVTCHTVGYLPFFALATIIHKSIQFESKLFVFDLLFCFLEISKYITLQLTVNM